MNIVLDGAVDDKMKQDIGMVVRRRVCLFFFFLISDLDTGENSLFSLCFFFPFAFETKKLRQVIRGNSIVTITALEPIVDT